MSKVTLHVWRVRGRAVPLALARLAVDPARLRATPGVRFAKVLGTGTGQGFGPGDADLTRFAAFVVWDDAEAAAGFETGPVGRGWRRMARASARLDLRPLSSRGRWSGRDPFAEDRPDPAGEDRPHSALAGDDRPGRGLANGEDPPTRGPAGMDRQPHTPNGERSGDDGPVLALTRARLRPTRAVTFWRAVPPVAAELHAAPGLLARFGVGEAPIGWQGTVSVWRRAADLVRFAYRQPEHRAAIARTATAGWYAEDLFARFAVLDVWGNRSVLGWAEPPEGGLSGTRMSEDRTASEDRTPSEDRAGRRPGAGRPRRMGGAGSG